jgi:hypothetical protein
VGVGPPYARRAAEEVCAPIGWGSAEPSPPAGHALPEVGHLACLHASETALVPWVHDAHVREIDAFRRILGRPFDKPTA